MTEKWQLLTVLHQAKVHLKDWIWYSLNSGFCIYVLYYYVYGDFTWVFRQLVYWMCNLEVYLRYFSYNYTLYKNPEFWLVNSRCIFRVFSYLGLISFIVTVAGVFAWWLNFVPSVPWYLRKCISLLYPRVPQTAKFIRNISSLPLYVRQRD